MDHLLNINKEFKDLWRLEIQIISTKMNWTKPVCVAYGDLKDLKRRTQSDKFLKTAFPIASNPKYDRRPGGLASMVYKFCDKKSKGIGIKNEIKEN